MLTMPARGASVINIVEGPFLLLQAARLPMPVWPGIVELTKAAAGFFLGS